MDHRNTLKNFISLLLLFQHVASNIGPSYGRRSVNTPFGIVRGETISPGMDDLPAITQFLGIPYGIAPNGQYRFNMAISASKWTHQPKDAFKKPPGRPPLRSRSLIT